MITLFLTALFDGNATKMQLVFFLDGEGSRFLMNMSTLFKLAYYRKSFC